jgi:uncharacterized protein (TIGR02099 family)
MSALARLFSGLLRLAFGLCALLLVLAALYVSLGRELVPLVAEYRDEIQARAQTALGVPLRIGRLEGRWSGFRPVVVVHDVMLGDGPDNVRLDQVRVAPDVFGSLLARQLRIAELQFDSLQLSVRQKEDGTWALEGLPARDPNARLDLDQIMKKAEIVAQLSLLNSQVTLEPQQREPLTFTYVNLSLHNSGGRQRLDGRLLLPDGQPLALQLRSRLDSRDWKASDAELYVSLPQTDWARWVPPSYLREWRLERFQLGGELWLGAAGGSLQRGVARLHAPELAAGHAQREAVKIEDVALDAYFTRHDKGFQLLLDSVAFNVGDSRWGNARLTVAHDLAEKDRDERWRLNADRIDLKPLIPVIEALAPLPATASEAMQTLQPQGWLRNLDVTFHPQLEGAKKLAFSANLDQVGWRGWHGVPAVENGTGSVQGDLGGGEVRVDADNFGFHLEHLFPERWHYRHVGGRMFWRLDDVGLTLRAPYIKVDGEEGQVGADFLIRLIKDPAAEDYMDLRVGIRDGDARFVGRYLPTRIPTFNPKLAEWLNTAIEAGKVDEGYFQYQGSLMKGADDAAHSLSLYFRAHDAQLTFQPGWPQVREARGEVLVEDSGVRVRVPEGRILDSRLSDVNVDIPHVPTGQVSRLLVEGKVGSNVVDALKILQDTPLGASGTFAGWQGEGDLQGALKLGIALATGGLADVVVDFTSQDARLRLSKPQLDLSQIKGQFRYDSARGLSAPDIRARILGQAVRGKALAEGRGGKPLTRIEANGSMPVKTLASWLGVTQALPLQGDLPYQMSLSLDGTDSQLRVASDLKGTTVDLPPPFGKAATQALPSVYRMTLQGSERRYWLEYGSLASLAYAAPSDKPAHGRGELRLADGPAVLPAEQGVRVRGKLEELDTNAWQDTLKRYGAGRQAGASQLVRGADLRIARLTGFGTQLDGLALQLTRVDAGWSAAVDSRQLQGKIVLPLAEAAPIVIDLQRLSFPPAKEKPAAGVDTAVEEDKPDPLAKVDPKVFPALDVRIAQVFQGDQLLGAWSLKARPTDKGVRFGDMDVQLKGLQLNGTLTWEGEPGVSSSWYQGRLQGKNLADVLLAWNFAPTATSESFRLDADGRWPGSPAWFSPKRFTGSLDANLRRGQFVEVQGTASALRVFGLLNFNSIGRRLRLDFSDLFGKGLSYDSVKGKLTGSSGVFVTREPIKLNGPSTELELNGTLDMVNDKVDAKVLVTLPVTNNLPLAALLVGAPAVGGALLIVDKLLGDRVARFASVQYRIEGDWQEPKISFDKPFEKPQ